MCCFFSLVLEVGLACIDADAQPPFLVLFSLDFGMTVTCFFFAICRVRDTHSAQLFEIDITRTITLETIALLAHSDYVKLPLS
jgi:hypothetical protein